MTYAVGSKVTVSAQLVKIIKFEVPGFGYYARTTTKRIYKFVDTDGNVVIWNTTGYLSVPGEIPEPDVDSYVTITGKVKCFSNYKGEDQVELERVKLVSLDAGTAHHKTALVADQVIDPTSSVIRMDYRNYKAHYADCETVKDSFQPGDGYTAPTIKVIIPVGRMKNSGVRGQKFSGYELINEYGEKVTYRAVCVENAIKRANKEYHGYNWKLHHIYNYSDYHKIW